MLPPPPHQFQQVISSICGSLWGLALNFPCRVGLDSSKYVSEMASVAPWHRDRGASTLSGQKWQQLWIALAGKATSANGVSNWASPGRGGAHSGTEKAQVWVKRNHRYFRCKSTINNNTVDLFSKASSPCFQRSHPKTFQKCLKLIQSLSLHSVLCWLLNPLPHCFPLKGWKDLHI